MTSSNYHPPIIISKGGQNAVEYQNVSVNSTWLGQIVYDPLKLG